MKRGFSLTDVRERGQFVNVRVESLQVGDKVRLDRRVWTVVFLDPVNDKIMLEN